MTGAIIIGPTLALADAVARMHHLSGGAWQHVTTPEQARAYLRATTRWHMPIPTHIIVLRHETGQGWLAETKLLSEWDEPF